MSALTSDEVWPCNASKQSPSPFVPSQNFGMPSRKTARLESPRLGILRVREIAASDCSLTKSGTGTALICCCTQLQSYRYITHINVFCFDEELLVEVRILCTWNLSNIMPEVLTAPACNYQLLTDLTSCIDMFNALYPFLSSSTT